MTETTAGARWRCEIKHGPEGEANYAWVYDDASRMVCTATTHHAKAIVECMNTRALSPAPVERREAVIHALKDTLRITMIEEFGELISARITEENMASTADAILALPCADEAAIRAEEREKCAKIAESVPVEQAAPYTTRRAIAAAIRSPKGDA